MAKIEPLGRWSAKAALQSAQEDVEDGDGVLILIEQKSANKYSYRSANLTNAEALYLMENNKFDMFFKEGE